MIGITSVLLIFGSIFTAKASFLDSCSNPNSGVFPPGGGEGGIPPYEPLINVNTPRCGGVLIQNQGEIVYKPMTPVLPNERCVWVIAAPQAWAYDVTLVQMDNSTNQPGSGMALIITDDLLVSYKPLCASSDSLWSRVLIITFATGDNIKPSNGFVIQYQASNQETFYAVSTQHVFHTSVSIFKYPVEGKMYQNWELSTFVFTPTNNFYTGVTRYVRYKRSGLVAYSCQDALHFYRFYFTPENGADHWRWQQTVCADTDSFQFPHNDLMFILFRSNDKDTDTGFWLKYA